jgi:hypoxanthine phosphoribosyltransferase
VHKDIKEILFTEEEIQQKIQQLATQINHDYAGRHLFILCVLKGAFIFLADITKKLEMSLEVDFMAVSSYGASSQSSGIVKITKDLDGSVEGKDILIIEDIIDTGLTLSYLIDVLERRNARSIRVATLFDKPHRRKAELEADYRGFLIPDEFIVGYGLDYAEKYRNLPYVGILKHELYAGHL